MQWKDIPIGSEIIRHDGTFKSKKISDQKQIITERDNKHWVSEVSSITFDYHSEIFKIILPYGYQSPLWKVLNGESPE